MRAERHKARAHQLRSTPPRAWSNWQVNPRLVGTCVNAAVGPITTGAATGAGPRAGTGRCDRWTQIWTSCASETPSRPLPGSLAHTSQSTRSTQTDRSKERRRGRFDSPVELAPCAPADRGSERHSMVGRHLAVRAIIVCPGSGLTGSLGITALRASLLIRVALAPTSCWQRTQVVGTAAQVSASPRASRFGILSMMLG